jgi:hypothetical protein
MVAAKYQRTVAPGCTDAVKVAVHQGITELRSLRRRRRGGGAVTGPPKRYNLDHFQPFSATPARTAADQADWLRSNVVRNFGF